MLPKISSLRVLQRLDVAAFLRWWGTGLLACLPARLRKALTPAPSALVLAWSPGEWQLLRRQGDEEQPLQRFAGDADEAAGAVLRGLQGRFPQRVLRLPADRVLSGTLSLPQVAEGSLRQVVGFEIDRLTPFASSEVYYAVQVLERQPAAKRIRVQFHVVPREVLDGLLERLQRFGFTPNAVEVAGAADGINLLPPARQPRQGLGQHLQRLTTLLLVLLLAAVVLLPLWQQRALVLALMPQVNVAQARAGELLKLREELDTLEASTSFLRQKKQAAAPVIDVLNELTRLLPDDTWVEQMDIRGAQIQVRGLSAEAAKLIGIVEGSPMFEGVTFASPVFADQQSGRDRFHLSARLAREPAP
ncbi:MAG TPA: PilN domain-containing protein [Candidatus Competibacteraceae bacterium]|nr:PilN domain-containing protein [Candidatus Competibacteraceae bacterium]